jgi:hypothetical protein
MVQVSVWRSPAGAGGEAALVSSTGAVKMDVFGLGYGCALVAERKKAWQE